MINLTISVDDVNPAQGYRLLGESPEKWFRQLNEEFGVKFNLFIPSNYHGQYPISQHKGWIQELGSIPWLELCFHGSLHQTTNPKQYGECEFGELNDEVEIGQRLHDMFWEWDQCGISPTGFRTPGWVMTESSKKCVERFIYDKRKIEYAAIHYEHNRGMTWNIPTLFGHDGIHQENISIHNVNETNPYGMIMFQSHIAGKHNHNIWNEQNYEQLKLSLTHLFEQYQPNPKFLRECL